MRRGGDELLANPLNTEGRLIFTRRERLSGASTHFVESVREIMEGKAEAGVKNGE